MLTEGRLILEFTFDDLMRIRMWHFAARQHCELIPRGIITGLQVLKFILIFSNILQIFGFSNALLFRDVNFVFFPKIDYRFEKIDFFSIIEFVCCSLSTAAI